MLEAENIFNKVRRWVEFLLSLHRKKVAKVTAIVVHSTEVRGHIRDSLGVRLGWLTLSSYNITQVT